MKKYLSKAKMSNIDLKNVDWLKIGMYLAIAFGLYKLYDLFFGSDKRDNKELTSAEEETLKTIEKGYIDDDDLTISHIQAETIAKQIKTEFDSYFFSVGNVTKLIYPLTTADKNLVIKKFGVYRYDPFFGDVQFYTLKNAVINLLKIDVVKQTMLSLFKPCNLFI